MDDVRERALDAAGKALARRALSRAALESRLAGVAPPEVCAAVVSDLERLGYVDDEALALGEVVAEAAPPAPEPEEAPSNGVPLAAAAGDA